MNENNNLANGVNSNELGNAFNGIELIEATLLDNVSGGIIAVAPKAPSERCRMGFV